jgi:hypothetical protein
MSAFGTKRRVMAAKGCDENEAIDAELKSEVGQRLFAAAKLGKPAGLGLSE